MTSFKEGKKGKLQRFTCNFSIDFWWSGVKVSFKLLYLLRRQKTGRFLWRLVLRKLCLPASPEVLKVVNRTSDENLANKHKNQQTLGIILTFPCVTLTELRLRVCTCCITLRISIVLKHCYQWLSSSIHSITLSKQGRFSRRMSTGSEPFSLLICFDATKCVLLSNFTLPETNCQKMWEKYASQ